mgnify:CR=1 FL=1
MICKIKFLPLKQLLIKEKNKPKDLIKLLEKEEYTLNGVLVNQEDKEKLKRIIEAAFWDAKEKNKRKK